MEDFEDRKSLRRDNIRQKKRKSGRSGSDNQEIKQKVKSFKKQKQDYFHDEEWHEWKERYS